MRIDTGWPPAASRASTLYCSPATTIDGTDSAAGDAFRGRRPCVGVCDEALIPRLGHLHRQLIDLPAVAELPRFQMWIRQPEFREAVAGPSRRLHVRRGAGQPRAEFIGDCAI